MQHQTRIKHFASNAPFVLVYPNFSITMDDFIKLSTVIESDFDIVANIAEAIESVFEGECKNNFTFLSLGSSWSGMFLHNSCHCMFNINLYKKSILGKDTYIIEGQRHDGDSYLFNEFFQKIRQQLLYPLAEKNDKMYFLDENDDSLGQYFYVSSLESKMQFLVSVKYMIEDSHYKTALEGIQMISDACANACADKQMFDLIVKSDLMTILVNKIKEIDMDVFENNWYWQYSLISLLNLAKINCKKFIHTLHATHNLLHTIYTKLEHIESQRESVRYLLPSRQHILNNSKKIFNKISNQLSNERMHLLVFVEAAKKIKYNDLATSQIETFTKALKNKKHWIMHISKFI